MQNQPSNSHESRVNKRSIVFLLAAAAQKCGFGAVFVEESLGTSLYFRLPRVHVDPTHAAKLAVAMEELIAESLPIEECRF